MKISALTEVEAQIGMFIGIMVAVVGGGIGIVFFTDVGWLMKGSSILGTISILGIQAFALKGLISQRRQLVEADKMMRVMK